MSARETLLAIPGGEALLNHFGRVPRFHDAELLEIVLRSSGPSTLRIHAFDMTNQVDENGFFVTEKHAVVTLTLESVRRIALSDFELKGIIESLEITKQEDGYTLAWEASYGVDGSLHAKRVRIELVPGRP